MDYVTGLRDVAISPDVEDNVCYVMVSLGHPGIKESISSLIIGPDAKLVSELQSIDMEICFAVYVILRKSVIIKSSIMLDINLSSILHRFIFSFVYGVGFSSCNVLKSALAIMIFLPFST